MGAHLLFKPPSVGTEPCHHRPPPASQRKPVMEAADWFVTDYKMLVDALTKYKVGFIGSGAWACAALTLATYNARCARVR